MDREQNTKVYRFGDYNLEGDSLTKKALREYYDKFYAGSEFTYYDESTTRKFLQSLLVKCGISSGCSILDVGCATGFYTKQFRDLGLWSVGIDISRAGIIKARSKYSTLSFVVGDAASMPFRLASFDALFVLGCSLTNTRDFHALRSYITYLTKYIKNGGVVVLIGGSNFTGEVSPHSEWIYHRYDEILQFVDRKAVGVKGPYVTNLKLLSRLGSVVLNPLSSFILRKCFGKKPSSVVYLISKTRAANS